jgi:hypothetical protein
MAQQRRTADGSRNCVPAAFGTKRIHTHTAGLFAGAAASAARGEGLASASKRRLHSNEQRSAGLRPRGPKPKR